MTVRTGRLARGGRGAARAAATFMAAALVGAGMMPGAAFAADARAPSREAEWRARLDASFDAARDDTHRPWSANSAWRAAVDARWRTLSRVDLWAKLVARSGVDSSAAGERARIDEADLRRAFADSAVDARLFYGTREFFTHEITARLVDDDAVARFARRYGARVRARRGALEADVLAAGLEDERGAVRRLAWVRLARSGRRLGLSASWRDDDPAGASPRRTLQAEAMLLGDPGRVSIAWAQQGAAVLPGGRMHWNAWVGDNFVTLAPDNARVALEARLARRRVREVGEVDVIARYAFTGERFVDDLASADPPGSLDRAVVVAFAHARRALDVRAAWRHRERWGAASLDDERVVLTATARLAHGADAWMRASLATRRAGAATEAPRWIGAGYERRTGAMAAGMHAMWLDEVGGGDELRTAADMRLDVGKRTQLVARLVQAAGRADVRRSGVVALQVRPAPHAFAVIAWGRPEAGDGPWPLEDPDLERGATLENRIVFTLRGEF